MPFSTNVVLPVNKGDKVRLLFNVSKEGDIAQEHVATVIKVERRYGRINHGKTKQNPLVYYIPPDGQGSSACDAVFIEEILEKSSVWHRPENIYRDIKNTLWMGRNGINAKRVRKHLVGDLFGCVAFCLAKLDIELVTPLHPIRVPNLYWKSKGRGLIASGIPTVTFGEGTIVVREKSFSKWVKDNATRLVYRSSELDDEETAANTQYEDEFYKDMEYEMEQEAIERRFDALEDDVYDEGEPIQ